MKQLSLTTADLMYVLKLAETEEALQSESQHLPNEMPVGITDRIKTISEQATTSKETGNSILVSATEIHNATISLLDSADDTGCSDDLIVVGKSALRFLANKVLGDIPMWLRTVA